MRIAFVGLVALAMAWLSAAGGLRASEFNDGLIAYLDSNYDLARRYWLPLAEAGDADSQFAIGMLHEQGQGVAIDHAGAAVWYRKAAEQGHADAQLSLGSLYSTGQGVVRDHGVAARWYFAAARQGNPQALYKLAEAYLFGLGVMPDRDRAGQLLRTAADQGYGRARQRLDMLGMPLGGARADFADGFDAPAADEAVGAPEAGGQVANEVAGTEPGPEPATAGEGGDDTSATMLNEPAVEAPRQEARTSATNAGSASEQQRAARLVTADNRPAPWPYALRLATYESADSAARGWQELAERFADVLGGLGAEIHRKDVGSAPVTSGIAPNRLCRILYLAKCDYSGTIHWGAAIAVSACATGPRDQELAALGADALEARDYEVAEGHLREALALNPTNEYALLNLGVVYHDTGRPELARRSYGEIIRLNRAERAARTVARKGVGPRPEDLARLNLTDLNLDPLNLDAPSPAPDWYGDNGHTEVTSLAQLYRGMGEMYEKLRQFADTMRTMTSSVMVAARELETRMAAAREATEEAEARLAEAAAAAAAAKARSAPATRDSDETPAMASKTTDAMDEDMAPADEGEAAIQLLVGSGNDADVAAADDAGDAGMAMADDGEGETGALARAEPVADANAGPPVRIHIASFRSEKGAARGWEMLKKAHADLLGELDLELRKVDFGSGMGVFYRVHVGPIANEGAAKSLCRELKDRGLYCAVAFL